MNPSNRDPAAIAAAFERADAIVALEGIVPDDNYRAIQRRVIAGELTSDQAVQLVIAQAQAAPWPRTRPRRREPIRRPEHPSQLLLAADH